MRWTPLSLPGLLALSGCATSDTPRWALQHASVTMAPDGASISGYQTWEFYREGWEEGRDQEDHLCARVQSIEGDAEPTLPSGCPGCIASFSLTLAELQTDCAGDEADDPSYAGVTLYAIGSVDNSVTELDPYPGDSMGWYVAWSTEDVDPIGFAYNDALDAGEEPEAAGLVAGLTYTLWPAFVWDLAVKG